MQPGAPDSVKCVLVGDGAVGKTSLLISYTEGRFPVDYVPSLLENGERDVLVDGRSVRLSFWDTAGSEAYDRLRALAYPHTNVFVVCYSVVSHSSHGNVCSKWVPEVMHHCPGATLLLVGTKCDLRRDPSTLQRLGAPLTAEDGAALAAKIGAAAYVECSALTAWGVPEVFETAVLCGLGKISAPPQPSCAIV